MTGYFLRAALSPQCTTISPSLKMEPEVNIKNRDITHSAAFVLIISSLTADDFSASLDESDESRCMSQSQ